MSTLQPRFWHEEFSLRDLRAANQFSRLQWQSPDAITRRIRKRLHTLVHHARTSVPYYRTRLEEAGTRSHRFDPIREWQTLPIITKEELRDAYPDGVVAGHLPGWRRISDRTSGSTGHPFRFFLDRRAMPVRAGARLFFYRQMGIEFPWVKQMMRNDLESVQGGEAEKRDWRWYLNYYERRLFGLIAGRRGGLSVDIPALQIGPRNLDEVVELLTDIQPDFLEIPSGKLRPIAKFILDSNLVGRIRPKAVVCGSETLTEDTRQIIGEAFRCRVFNRYGSRELGFMAQSCPENPDVMHVNSGLVFLEVINAHGGPCEPGEAGRVIVTDLHNMVMPLIRYSTGDVAVLGERCRCGRGLPVLRSLEGRQGAYLSLPDGRKVTEGMLGHMLFVRESLNFSDQVRAYQAIQLDRRRCVLKIVPSGAFLIGDATALKTYMHDVTGLDVTIDLVTDIPAEPSGKHAIIKRLFDDQAETRRARAVYP